MTARLCRKCGEPIGWLDALLGGGLCQQCGRAEKVAKVERDQKTRELTRLKPEFRRYIACADCSFPAGQTRIVTRGQYHRFIGGAQPIYDSLKFWCSQCRRSYCLTCVHYRIQDRSTDFVCPRCAAKTESHPPAEARPLAEQIRDLELQS